jgi:methylated-DNA-[protein]-cysteine S-methyltransferase
MSKNATPGFSEKVWELTAQIPAGRVSTYGDLADALGTNGCRAVGNALRHNPHAPAVPCHRVVGSSGDLTGYAGGLAAKRRLLESEGVRVVNNRVDLRIYRWRP